MFFNFNCNGDGLEIIFHVKHKHNIDVWRDGERKRKRDSEIEKEKKESIWFSIFSSFSAPNNWLLMTYCLSLKFIENGWFCLIGSKLCLTFLTNSCYISLWTWNVLMYSLPSNTPKWMLFDFVVCFYMFYSVSFV